MSFTAPIFTTLTNIQYIFTYLPHTELSKSDKKDVQNRAQFHLCRELTLRPFTSSIFTKLLFNVIARTPSTLNFTIHGLLRHAR